MHRSIIGLTDAIQSIADGKSVLKDNDGVKTFKRKLEGVEQDLAANHRITEANSYYAEMEDCTARIAAKLRGIDNIDLNMHSSNNGTDDDPVSNQKRFIDDQCFRAQSMLTGEYYLRNLNTFDISKDMAELDERVNFTAKNWKHALVELGINESELADLKPPEIEANQEIIVEKSDTRKVRRNSVMTQPRASVTAVEAEYSDYNTAELSELNQIISQFMDHAFLNGSNSHHMSQEILNRCAQFKRKVLRLTNQLIEDERSNVKSELRDAQRNVRSLESEIALLHTQNEEAETVIRSQKESDKQIRTLVERKFVETLNQLGDNIRRIDTKLEAQEEQKSALLKRSAEAQAMLQELRRERLHADPFVRRRAENLVKGLLRNLNEKDLREQEEREEVVQSSYQQWKRITGFCTEKERHLQLMRTQEETLKRDLVEHKERIERERGIYREQVKVLKSRDDEQSNKLRILEETLSDKARLERRKLHFDSIAEEKRRSQQTNQSIKASEEVDLDEYEERLMRQGPAEESADSARGTDSEKQGGDDEGEESRGDSSSSSSTSPDSSDTETAEATRQKVRREESGRFPVKQEGVRRVLPLCDPRTEVVLGITREHTKRQEITSSVFNHVPRPAAIPYATGSEALDKAALNKAQKVLASLRTPAPFSPISTSEVAAPPPPTETWATSTSSPTRSAKLKFADRFDGAHSRERRRSTLSSSKVKFGFWADAEPADVDDSSGSSQGGGEADEEGDGPGGLKSKAVAVHSLTSTACYVALYYRYLKKFPNLNFKRDNPRLEFAQEPKPRSTSTPDAADSAEKGAKSKASEVVRNNNRFQFTIKEGLVVVKEALDSLLSAKCVDKILASEVLQKISDLERRVRLLALPGEEQEARYQLHHLCVSLIHTILSRAPRLLLLKNNRKLFVEINSCMLALLGVVLNCSLVFWQPESMRRTAVAEGGVAPERVEFICAHLIELVLTMGEVDKSSKGSVLSEQRRASAPSRQKVSSKTFKVEKAPDAPLGPSGFVSLLRIQTAELLRPAPSLHNKTSSATAGANQGGQQLHHKYVGVNYHELFEVFNRIVDEDQPVASAVLNEGMFSMKHRHALLALQLFLYLSLNRKETPLSDAILLLNKGMQDGEKSAYSSDSAVPCDVDILLQQIHPGMVPALLSLELMRRVLEEEFRRVAFLQMIRTSHESASDLQFLNVQFSSGFDVSMKRVRDSEKSESSIHTNPHAYSAKITPEGSQLDSPLAPAVAGAELDTSKGLGVVAAAGVREVPPLLVSRFKSTKDVHSQWVEDLEKQLGQLSEEIADLVHPAQEAGVPVREPAFLGNRAHRSLPVSEKRNTVSSRRPAAIPLPDTLVYKLLAHVNTLRNIAATHSINGLAHVTATLPAFEQVIQELIAARSKLMAIVTAMTWPMRKKLDWLKLKYNTLLEESSTANDEIGDFQALVERYESDIATYKASLLQVDREKHTMAYRRTKMLKLDEHDPQIQDLIVEHATDEYLTQLTDFRAREARLHATIAQFSTEYDHLNAQSETLRAAQRSLHGIDLAQKDAERKLDLAPQIGTPEFAPLEEDVERNRPVPATPKLNSELLSAVDGFMQTQRLAEVVPSSTLQDALAKEVISAQLVVQAAQEQNRARRKLKNMIRPKLPLFGMAATLQRRQQPSLPSKLMGFSKRIDSGLVAVPTHGDLSQQSTSTGAALGASAPTTAAGAVVYDGALQKEGMLPDLFGQQHPAVMTERIRQSMLRKGSRKRSDREQRRFSDVVDQFMLSHFGGTEFYPESVQQVPADSSLAGNLSSDPIAHKAAVRELHRHLSSALRDGAQSPPGFIKKPDLALMARKDRAFFSLLQRDEPFHYKQFLKSDVHAHSTPLDVKSLARLLRRMQRQHRADSKDRSGKAGNSTAAAPAATESNQRRFSNAEFDDDLSDDDVFCDMALLERDEDDSDEEGGTSQADRHLRQSHGNRQRTGGTGDSGSRDQNVGLGITYAEYLLWKAKRKQQLVGDRQLEALKNSLNIQLRSARRGQSLEATAEMKEGDEASEEAILTEQQFEELMASGGSLGIEAQESQLGHTPMGDLSAVMCEVDSLLSRSASRAEVVASSKRKYSSKRQSVGSALHFNIAALKAADLTEADSESVAEAGRRARGASLRSARASLSLQSRTSMLVKLNRAIAALDQHKVSRSDTAGIAQSDRPSVRASLIMDPVSSATNPTSIRRSVIGRPSMHCKRHSQADLPIEEARIIAHSIVHGTTPQQTADGAGLGLTEKDRTAVAKKGFGAGYDMQILEYIANDELILSGWESVDLLKMNDNETFSGHTFRFDEQDDKERATTLKLFAAQIASAAEKSVSAVESEFKAAIINLNRLVGKKVTDAEVKVIAPEKAAAAPAGEEAPSECDSTSAVPAAPAPDKTTAPRLDRHRHHQAIWATGETAVQRIDRLSANSSNAKTTEAEAPSSAGSTVNSRPESMAESRPEEGGELLSDPRRPEQPRPSASFASPRKNKVFIAEPASASRAVD